MKSILICLLLAGCASGVHMTDEEAKACRDQGCSVWTDADLMQLANKVGSAAYRKGWSDATQQHGKDL
jgi:hypothetical protein